MPKNDLNGTQKMLVKEFLDTFISGVIALHDMGKLDALTQILEHSQKLARTLDMRSKRYIKDFIKETTPSYTQDGHLIWFSLTLNRLFQLCLGRSGDLRLEQTGGWLTEAQKKSLRLLTANLLQESIEAIESQLLKTGHTLS